MALSAMVLVPLALALLYLFPGLLPRLLFLPRLVGRVPRMVAWLRGAGFSPTKKRLFPVTDTIILTTIWIFSRRDHGSDLLL